MRTSARWARRIIPVSAGGGRLWRLALLAPGLLAAGSDAPAADLGHLTLGGAGCVAVAADYDGDGKADPAVYREADGLWCAALSSNAWQAAGLALGGIGWLPAQADYDGDGKADPAVYAPATFAWMGCLSGSGYQPASAQFGADGYLPAPADYDGDGRADLTVFRAATGDWYSQPSDDPGPVTAGTAARLRATLEAQGFTVRQGLVTNVDVVALFQAGIVPSCYGNNRDSPYLAPILPIPPEQTASNTLPFTFRLRSDEAVVWAGRTPPEMVYYSLQPFLAQRLRLFNNIGDTLNHVTLATAGTPGGRAGDPFGKDTVVIFASDRGVLAAARAAALDAGYSSNLVNTIALPDAVLNLGLEAQADELQMLLRMAFPADTNAVNAYIAAPPLTVFRATPAVAPAPDPLPMPALRVRGTGSTEMEYGAALDALQAAVLAAYPGCAATQLVTSVAVPQSLSASQEYFDTLAETRDAAYLATGEFALASNAFLVAFGVNHVASGKATYCSVNVYGATPVEDSPGNKEMAGVASINSVQHFAGTAADYLPEHPLAGQLWAYTIAWNNPSGQPHCLVIPPPTGRIKLQVLQVISRVYIEPGCAVGPATEELLFDRVLLFRPGP